uniref:Exostosin GT47 domain-containing protein n=1 Tax=Kalanchoe fedtschenkoi TaxID=63787 RepID=A0A7N0UA91_KALFE
MEGNQAPEFTETAHLTTETETSPPAPPAPLSIKFLLAITPLILASFYVSFLGPTVFVWDFKSSLLLRSSSSIVQGGGGVRVAPPPSASVDFVSPVKKDVSANVSTVTSSPSAAIESREKASVEINEAIALRRYTKLERLELGLQMARTAIRDAKRGNQTDLTEDKDYVPTGPMYWHHKAFHRSYLEMEKQLRIYIYDEGEPPLFHTGPCQGILATEGYFINQLEMDTRFVTRDPEKAQLFFLSFSVTYMARYVYVRDNHHWRAMKHTIRDYVRVISDKYPYWNRSLGADHFMLACHDWGPKLSLWVPNLYNNSIRALCNANTSERFIPSKDVSIPEINLPSGDLKGLVGGPPPSEREILAFFAGGGDHGPIRPILLKHWENKDKDMEVHQYLPKGVDYYQMMRRAKFCLCPSGYEVASPRVGEALHTGCVPVLLSSAYTAPFSDVLNWNAFSVTVPVEDIPNLKNILTSISTKRYLTLQRRGVQIRRHFVVNFPPKRYDMYHMILHSIWLRRLNVRINEEDHQAE